MAEEHDVSTVRISHGLISTTGPASAAAIYTAKSVNVDGDSIGNGIFASRDYGAGEHVVGMPRPLVASLDNERLKDTCANCFMWTEGSNIGSRLYVKKDAKVSACAGCLRFRYCGKQCQKQAWNRGHKHECKSLKPLGDKEMPKAVLVTMKLLIRRKHGLIPDEAWQMLCQLPSHIDDFKSNGQYPNIELMAMGTRKYSWTEDAFSKDFVEAMYARILTNALTLITPTLDPLGIFVDPIISQLNHSCDPNAFVMMDGSKAFIRTLRPIKKDEELLISYIDTTLPYTRRQRDLQARWFFTCKCSKCRKGPTQREDEWAIEPSQLSREYKKIADGLLEKEDDASDPANYVGESQDEKRVAALQGQAFAYYEQTQHAPPDQVSNIILEDGMRFCHQSRLWAIDRQPWPALRDDLIVALISKGTFADAFEHCIRRWHCISPKLYPSEAHPVRVVQTWQMAMLALNLSGNIGSPWPVPGINMGLITLVLVMDVLRVCGLSHGEHSIFAKSVEQKNEELTRGLVSKLGGLEETKKLIKTHAMPQRRLLQDMADGLVE